MNIFVNDYRQLYDKILGKEEGTLNHKEILHGVTIYRVVVGLGLAFLIFVSSLEQTTEAATAYSMVFLLIAYVISTVIPIMLIRHQPLRVLNPNFFLVSAVGELLFVLILSWRYPDHEHVVLLMLFMPLALLTRTTTTERKLIPIIAIFCVLTVQSGAIFLQQNEGDIWLWVADLPLLFIFVVVILWALWRHGQQGRDNLIRANLELAMTHLQKQVNSSLLFLRVPARYAELDTLFLIMTAPVAVYRDFLYPDVVALNQNSHSMVAAAFRDKQMAVALSPNELRQRLAQTNSIRDYNLQTGAALSLPNRHGVLSCYWDIPNPPLEGIEALLQPHLRHLADYLNRQSGYIQAWIEKRSTSNLIPTSDWERTNKLAQSMSQNTDIWESADLLVDGITDISGAKGACVLFFDEELQQFQADERGHGISPNCAPELVSSIFSLTEMQAWLVDRKRECISMHVPVGSQYNLAFPLRIRKDDGAVQSNGTNWKWIGLLLLDLGSIQRISILKRRQLEMIALSASSDLRNCQLYLRSNTDRQAQTALTKIITLLFDEHGIPKSEQAFLRGVEQVLQDGLDEHHSTTLGIVCRENDYFVKERWFTTGGFKWSDIEGDKIFSDEIATLLKSQKESKILCFDYKGKQPSRFSNKFSASYATSISLTECETLIIYVNYYKAEPQHRYVSRRILNLLTNPIKRAWQMWHRWQTLVEEERVYQRQFWTYEIHDQLNELQSKVIRPLELHQMRFERNGQGDYDDQLLEIYQSTRGINTTLKQVNDDIRDPVYQRDGLFAALRNLYSRVPSTFSLNVSCSGAEPDIRLAGPLYLIACEAVTNASKHGAHKALIDLKCKASQIELTIKDNGPGYDGEEQTGSGTGLMRYQAQMIGAEIEWHKSENESTTLTVLYRYGTQTSWLPKDLNL